MTAAGVPATDDSGRGRGGHCAAGRHYDCSGHLGCECECHSDPTPARPGTAELREEIARWLMYRDEIDWDSQDEEVRDFYRTEADEFLTEPAMQRLLAVEQRVEDVLAKTERDASMNDETARSLRSALEARTRHEGLRDAYDHSAARLRRALGGGDDA